LNHVGLCGSLAPAETRRRSVPLNLYDLKVELARALSLLFLPVLVACHRPVDAAACHARVQNMAAHLDAPRSLDEIRRTASPALAAQLDAIAAEPLPARRATAFAKAMAEDLRDCPQAGDVFARLSAARADSMTDSVRANLPPALEACGCKASPEDVGGLLEALDAKGHDGL
jgi:hypothetical protein